MTDKLKILFVDDDKEISELYRIHGETAGFETNVCTSGGEALEFIEKNPVDIVILDLAMPTMDGIRTAKEIRKNENNAEREPVEILFLTAFDKTDTTENAAKKIGVRHIYRKPHDISSIMADVKQMERGKIIKPSQKGSANPNWLICLIAVVLQIVTVSLGLWLLNKQDVAAAYRWADMKSQRDQLRKVCDSNYLIGLQKDKFIENSNLKMPPEISGAIQCLVSESKEK